MKPNRSADLRMDETTLKIGGLLEVAEAQQHAVAAQLEQLKRQTEALAQAVANVNTAANNAVIALEEAAGAAINRSIRDSLSQAAKTALAALYHFFIGLNIIIFKQPGVLSSKQKE